MIGINISASFFPAISIRVGNPDLPPIRNSKEFLVAAVYETNSSLRILQMVIQSVFSITITVEVVLTPVRIQSHHIAIAIGVYTESKLSVIDPSIYM